MKRISLGIIASAIAAACGFSHAAAAASPANLMVSAKEHARVENLWALRAQQRTRYAKAPAVSQQKERRAARRAHPHGF